MLKFLQTSDEVVDLLQSLSSCPELSSFRVGFAGSYSTGTNKKASAIDIVLKLKENGDKNEIGSIYINSFIGQFMESAYSNKYHILWLDMLEKNEVAVHDFMAAEGLEANPESVYTNVVSEVRWVDDEQKHGDLEDSIYTSDDDDDDYTDEDDETSDDE